MEEVGFEKIRQQLAELQELRVVVLDGAYITAVERDLEKQSLKIIELDLSRNLMEGWREITAICKSLRCLRCLKLEYVRYVIYLWPASLLILCSIAVIHSVGPGTLSKSRNHQVSMKILGN